jgi:hypothetical protein
MMKFNFLVAAFITLLPNFAFADQGMSTVDAMSAFPMDQGAPQYIIVKSVAAPDVEIQSAPGNPMSVVLEAGSDSQKNAESFLNKKVKIKRVFGRDPNGQPVPGMEIEVGVGGFINVYKCEQNSINGFTTYKGTCFTRLIVTVPGLPTIPVYVNKVKVN